MQKGNFNSLRFNMGQNQLYDQKMQLIGQQNNMAGGAVLHHENWESEGP